MPFYENVFLVRPDISAQQVETLAQSFSDSIVEGGGRVTKVEHWGLRNLAYRIKKNKKAHYVLFNLDAPANVVHSFEQSMRMSEDVIRSLTIRLNELDEEPSIIMQNRNREDRPPHRSHAHIDNKVEDRSETSKNTNSNLIDDQKPADSSEESDPNNEQPLSNLTDKDEV